MQSAKPEPPEEQRKRMRKNKCSLRQTMPARSQEFLQDEEFEERKKREKRD
ncbi:MAG: hypothetical protein ACOC4J_03145 [Bacteroidota bacterium]